jgi:hypothetical protein
VPYASAYVVVPYKYTLARWQIVKGVSVGVAVPVPVFVCVPVILGEGDSDGVGDILGNTISYTKLYLQAGISLVNMACS